MDWYFPGPFVIAALLVVIVPGPVMAIIAHNTVRHGTIPGLLTVLGVELGELCLLAAMLAGFAISAEVCPVLFRWVGLAGTLYLAWLAASALRALRAHGAPAADASASRASKPLVEGLTVAVANPAALVFYAAFFSQFLRPDLSIVRQTVLLGAIYLGIALAFDLVLVLTLARIRLSAASARLGLMLNLGSAALYLTIAVIGALGFAGVRV
jgi:threonine/homoserine/homoserine lactone efflux protein